MTSHTDSPPKILTFKEAKFAHACGMPIDVKQNYKWVHITNRHYFHDVEKAAYTDYINAEHRIRPQAADVQGS